MMPARRTTTLISLLLALAGCSADAPLLSQSGFASSGAGGGPPADSSPAAIAACRQRAEEAFARQDRASAIDPGRNPVDSPFSGVPLSSGINSLANRSSYNRFYTDCLRSRGSVQSPGPTGPAAPLGQR